MFNLNIMTHRYIKISRHIKGKCSVLLLQVFEQLYDSIIIIEYCLGLRQRIEHQ